MPSQAQHAPGSSQSELLRCLSQLNDDVWSEVLLPKLLEQGSAANMALSCMQLRDMCHRNRQRLNLGRLHTSSDPQAVQDWTANLAEHFPACRHIQFVLKGTAGYQIMPFVLPAIARCVGQAGREMHGRLCVHMGVYAVFAAALWCGT